MGTIESSQPTSKSSWDSQDFVGISMVLKMSHFRKSTGPRRVKEMDTPNNWLIYHIHLTFSRCDVHKFVLWRTPNASYFGSNITIQEIWYNSKVSDINTNYIHITVEFYHLWPHH